MFEQNPKLRNIHPTKLRIINEIKEQSKYQSAEELLPQILQINQELKRRNLSFTKEESALLLEAMEESMSPAERQKFQMIKSFSCNKNGCLTRYKTMSGNRFLSISSANITYIQYLRSYPVRKFLLRCCQSAYQRRSPLHGQVRHPYPRPLRQEPFLLPYR